MAEARDDETAGPVRSWPPTSYAAHLPLPGAAARLVAFLDGALELFWRNPLLYASLIFAALYSAWWGYTDFYGEQLRRVPPETWPFIADSPNAVLMFVVGSLAIKAGWDALPRPYGPIFTFLVHLGVVWNLKVGLWTDVVILYHYEHFFTGGTANLVLQWMLVVSHAGMVAFALLLFRKTYPLPTWGYLLLMAYLLLGDFVDYAYAHFFLDDAVRLWPNGVPATDISFVALVTVFLSVSSVTLLAWGLRLRGPPVDR